MLHSSQSHSTERWGNVSVKYHSTENDKKYTRDICSFNDKVTLMSSRLVFKAICIEVAGIAESELGNYLIKCTCDRKPLR